MNGFINSIFHRLNRPSSILSVVFVGAFLETTVLPIPFEVMLVPLMLRYRNQLWLIVSTALAGCMAGALSGYAIGMFAFQTFGQTLLQWLGAEQTMDAFTERLQDTGFWSVFLVGFTPVPIQVATLGAGFVTLSIVTFSLAMLLSRGLRYGGLGVLVHLFGDRTQELLQRHRVGALIVGLILMLILIYALFSPDPTG